MAETMPMGTENAYAFTSQPKVLKNVTKYRDQRIPQDADNEKSLYSNIMWDRRVIRGNTYSLKVLPATAPPEPLEVQRQQEARRRAAARRRAQEQMRPRTPEAVDGRTHGAVQTELYLEELSDRVEEADAGIQTDAFMDRPPTPLFIPAKSGADVETQIAEGDLFDFDIEVKPVLEVLVGKTLEQALLEVAEEEELAALRRQQRQFEELRAAEVAEQQRLEEQERRRREEKERRLRQLQEVRELEKKTADKLAAKAFALAYLTDLVPAVYGTLADAGYFYDPVERELERTFLPWLGNAVADRLANNQRGRILLDGLLREVVESRLETYTVPPSVVPPAEQQEGRTSEVPQPQQQKQEAPAFAEEPKVEQPPHPEQAPPPAEQTGEDATKPEEAPPS